MEDITLGSIATWAAFIVGLGGSIIAIINGVKKAVSKLLEPVTKQITAVDMENCKNYLVRFLADVDRGEHIDEIERERFWEQYEHYCKIGGNSYIKDKVNRLQKENKL